MCRGTHSQPQTATSTRDIHARATKLEKYDESTQSQNFESLSFIHFVQYLISLVNVKVQFVVKIDQKDSTEEVVKQKTKLMVTGPRVLYAVPI